MLKLTQSSYPDNIAEVGSVVGGFKFGKLSATSPMPHEAHAHSHGCHKLSKQFKTHLKRRRKSTQSCSVQKHCNFSWLPSSSVISASNILAVTPAGGKVSLGESYTAAALLDIQLPWFQSSGRYTCNIQILPCPSYQNV